MIYLGDFVEDDTVHFIWSSNDSSGASITRGTDGTVSVYKDNGLTQSVAGITDTEDFDSLTGIHACTIDTSADAFYATGANYTVVLSAATIDSQTVNAVLAHFSIENRSTTAIKSDTAAILVDTADMQPKLGSPAGADMSTDIAAVKSDTAAVLVDTADMQPKLGTITDLGNGATIGVNLSDMAGTTFNPTTDSQEVIKDTFAALNDVSSADVLTQVTTGLALIGLDHLIGNSVTGTDVADNSIIAKLVSKEATADWDDFVNTTDSLQATADAISGLNDLSAAAVNAEVVDALATDTYAELAAVPSATSTLADKLNWMFLLARNKVTQTATTQLVRNDADGATVGTSTISDDGTTFIRGEFV
jgi:hypothetical protein